MAPATARAGGPACPAEERVRAVKLAHAARGHADAGDPDAALALLKEAWRACPDARLRHAQGKVLRQAGRLPEALSAFRACVDEGDEHDGVLCAPEISAVEALLARGALIIQCDAPGAVVALDDGPPVPVGRLEVAAGRHALTVLAEGRVPLRGVIDVRGGDEVRFEARLSEMRGAPGGPGEPMPGADAGTGAPARPAAAWSNWLGVGLGSALVLASIVPFAQDALDRRDARRSSATYSGDTVTPTNVVIGSALAGLGLSAIVTAVALWPRAPSVGVAPLPGGAATTLEVSW